MTQDRIREALLPCPICGQEPTIYSHRYEDEGYDAVDCLQNKDGHFCGVHADSPAEAMAVWNKRAALAEPAAVQGVPDKCACRESLTNTIGRCSRCQKVVVATTPQAPAPSPPTIKQMVNRFLAWPLPKYFRPDCGISFDGRGKDASGYDKGWPVGTNLFTADQAREMFEYANAPQAPAQPAPPAQMKEPT